MGGEGSGRCRSSGSLRTVERAAAFDIRAWAREGLLIDGQWFAASFVGRGYGFQVTVQIEGHTVRILRHFDGPPNRVPIGFRVQLAQTYPRFGGVRWWFLCPRPDCRRRVALVYAAGREFACRTCLGLAYESQRENRRWRALRRAQKIRARLGAGADITKPFPLKPRGMHVVTYLRYMRRMSKAEQGFWTAGKLGGKGLEVVSSDQEYGWP